MQSTFSEIFRLIQETDFKNPSALTYESAIALLNQNPIAKAILERYFPDKLKSFLRNLSHLYRDLRHEIRPQQNIHDFTNNNIQRNDTIEVLQWSRSQLEEYHIAITEENASSVANDFCNRTQELCTPSHIQRLYPEKTSAQISAIVIDFKDFIEYICQSSQTIELLPILVAYYLDVHKQSEEELADHVFSFLNDLNSSRVSNKDVHPKVISANHPLSKGIDRDWSCIKGLEEDMTYTLLLRNRAKNTEQSSALQTRTNAVTPEEYTQALFDWVITHNQSLSSEFINLIIAIIVDENYQLSQSQHESFYLSFENASQKEAILSRLVTSKYNQLLEECGQITHTSQSDFLNYYYALYPDLLESGLLSIEKIDCAHALRANKPIMIELRRKFSAYIALPQIHETIFYKPNTRLTESLRQYINFVALCDFIKDTPHLYENLIQSIEDLTPDALFNYTWNIKNYLQLQHAIKAAHNHSLSLQFSQDDQRAFEQILHEDISQLIQEGLYRHFESMITQPSATAEAMVNKLATNGLSSTDLETLSFEKSIYFSTFFIKKSENGESTIIDLNDSESAKELQSSLIEQLSSLMSPQWVEALDRILYPMGLFNSCINVIQSIKTEFSYDRSDVSRKLLECCERIDILQSRIIRESYQNPLFELFLLDSPQTIQALFETQTLLIEKISKEKALYKPERRHLIRINFNRMTTHKNDYTLYCAQDTLFRMYSMMIADFMRIHFSEIQSRPLDHIDRFDRELIRMIARANFSLEHKKELLHILVPLDTLSLNQHPYFWQFLYSIAIDRALLEYFTAQLHSEQKNSVLLTTILASSGYEDFVTMKHLIEQIDREYLQEKNLFDADTTPIESLKIFIDENVLSDKTLFVAFKACLTQEHYEMAYFLCTTKIAISYDRLRIITNLHPNLPKKIQNAIMDNYFSYTKNPFSIASKMQNILEMLRPLVIDLRNTQGFLIRHYHLPLNNETPYTYFRAILQSEELYRNCDTLADVCSILALLDILPSAITYVDGIGFEEFKFDLLSPSLQNILKGIVREMVIPKSFIKYYRTYANNQAMANAISFLLIKYANEISWDRAYHDRFLCQPMFSGPTSNLEPCMISEYIAKTACRVWLTLLLKSSDAESIVCQATYLSSIANLMTFSEKAFMSSIGYERIFESTLNILFSSDLLKPHHATLTDDLVNVCIQYRSKAIFASLRNQIGAEKMNSALQSFLEWKLAQGQKDGYIAGPGREQYALRTFTRHMLESLSNTPGINTTALKKIYSSYGAEKDLASRFVPEKKFQSFIQYTQWVSEYTYQLAPQFSGKADSKTDRCRWMLSVFESCAQESDIMLKTLASTFEYMARGEWIYIIEIAAKKQSSKKIINAVLVGSYFDVTAILCAIEMICRYHQTFDFLAMRYYGHIGNACALSTEFSRKSNPFAQEKEIIAHTPFMMGCTLFDLAVPHRNVAVIKGIDQIFKPRSNSDRSFIERILTESFSKKGYSLTKLSVYTEKNQMDIVHCIEDAMPYLSRDYFNDMILKMNPKHYPLQVAYKERNLRFIEAYYDKTLHTIQDYYSLILALYETPCFTEFMTDTCDRVHEIALIGQSPCQDMISPKDHARIAEAILVHGDIRILKYLSFNMLVLCRNISMILQGDLRFISDDRDHNLITIRSTGITKDRGDYIQDLIQVADIVSVPPFWRDEFLSILHNLDKIFFNQTERFTHLIMYVLLAAPAHHEEGLIWYCREYVKSLLRCCEIASQIGQILSADSRYQERAEEILARFVKIIDETWVIHSESSLQEIAQYYHEHPDTMITSLFTKHYANKSAEQLAIWERYHSCIPKPPLLLSRTSSKDESEGMRNSFNKDR